MDLCDHEKKELGKDFELLEKLEKQLRFEDDVRKQGKLNENIEEIKQRIRKREIEINSLKTNPVQPTISTPLAAGKLDTKSPKKQNIDFSASNVSNDLKSACTVLESARHCCRVSLSITRVGSNIIALKAHP